MNSKRLKQIALVVDALPNIGPSEQMEAVRMFTELFDEVKRTHNIIRKKNKLLRQAVEAIDLSIWTELWDEIQKDLKER